MRVKTAKHIVEILSSSDSPNLVFLPLVTDTKFGQAHPYRGRRIRCPRI